MKLHSGRILETLTPSRHGRGALRGRDNNDGRSTGSGGGPRKDGDLIAVSSEGPVSVLVVGEECTASSLDEEIGISSIFKDTSDVDIFMASSREQTCWEELDDWWIELGFELQFEDDMDIGSLKATVPFSTPNLCFGAFF